MIDMQTFKVGVAWQAVSQISFCLSTQYYNDILDAITLLRFLRIIAC